MEAGTWAEWFGAAGTILAFFLGLWLLKREGDDRRRRDERKRRRQATGAIMSEPRAGQPSRGIESWEDRENVFRTETGVDRWELPYTVIVKNTSDAVLHDLKLVVTWVSETEVTMVNGSLAQFTLPYARLLPGEDWKPTVTFRVAATGDGTALPPEHRVVNTLRFRDAYDVEWTLNENHDLNEASATPAAPAQAGRAAREVRPW
jgi:hypothetical protein